LELLVHHRVSQEDIVRLASVKRRGRIVDSGGDGANNIQKRVRDLIYDLASQAHVHLEHARKLRSNDFSDKNGRDDQKKMYESTRLILLPAAIVDHYLNILRKIDFDILDPKISTSYDWLALTLWWRKFTKTF